MFSTELVSSGRLLTMNIICPGLKWSIISLEPTARLLEYRILGVENKNDLEEGKKVGICDTMLES